MSIRVFSSDFGKKPMTRKVILDVDPGISDALALCLALSDPSLDVIAVTATGGNIDPEQSSRNVHAIVEQIDPSRWPRIGAADTEQLLRTDRRQLFGNDGLCGVNLRVAELHNRHSSLKVLSDEIRASSGDITIIAGGPLCNIASLLQYEPDLATQIGHLILVGGTFKGPGDVTAAAEFNVYCDADAAHKVFHSPVTKTILPLCVTSEVTLDISILDLLKGITHSHASLLNRLLPGAFRAYRQHLAKEGIFSSEAVAVVSVLHPELFQTERYFGDVEISSGITHGATVFDRRSVTSQQPNMDVVVQIDTSAVIDCIIRGIAS